MNGSLKILKAGPSVGVVGIEKFESFLRTPLPNEYREFLLKYDGGEPEPDGIELGGDWTDLRSFFHLRESDSPKWIYWILEEFNELFNVKRLLPIARDSGSGLFCLNVDTGMVVFVDYTEPEYTEYLIASSFNGLLQRLRTCCD
jgi:hypothetical protein